VSGREGFYFLYFIASALVPSFLPGKPREKALSGKFATTAASGAAVIAQYFGLEDLGLYGRLNVRFFHSITSSGTDTYACFSSYSIAFGALLPLLI
jgi:hypothetical protein